jgi:alpha-aminoadipic semialdehyde synthase
LRANRNARSQIASSNKKVLILGAGFVSEPVVEYLARDPNTQVTVCSALKKELDKLAAKYTQVVPTMLDVTRSKEELEKLLKNHQVVISLLPYSFHPSIAELCIKYKVNMVTASYLTKPMQNLHDQ